NAEMQPLIIRIAEIGEQGLKLDRTIDQGWLAEVLSDDLPSPFEPEAPAQLGGRIRRVGLDLVVEASLVLALRSECASCLAPFSLSLPVGFQLTLRPAPGGRELPAEIELRAEDLDEAFYSGEELDLADLVREQILLALPMYPRCKPDCRGLCPGCGANLNTDACRCEEEAVDPRLAALKDIDIKAKP
ncbi:MAG: DUF177 domain-containing protein, partial [Deltaproteobacteria bacterium]|nr:DUF177 domain-containing protein [Deltaproteobacteria bacterium]